MGYEATISGLFFSSVMIIIFLSAVRRSQFGWIIISCEYFYLIGLGVAPLIISIFDIDSFGIHLNYEQRNGKLGLAPYIHTTLYCVGAMYGYFHSRKHSYSISARIISIARQYDLNNYKAFYWVTGFSLLANGLYFYFVGVEIAITNASLTRINEFSGLIGYEQYQFLKRLALLGSFSIIFIPYILSDGRSNISAFLILVAVTIPIYLLSVARSAVLDTLGIFIILFFTSQKRWGVFFPIVAILTCCALLFTFVYGKNFVSALSSYLFMKSDFKLIRFADNSSGITSFLGQFLHLLYSVDAGILNFFKHGPSLAKDVLLSPFGVVPSSWFSSIGLDSISYQKVPTLEMSSSINTSYFVGEGETYIPPYYTGISAYLFPYGGAFIFGYIRFWGYVVIEQTWIDLRERPQYIWFPYLLLLLGINVMLFIPTTVSLAVFILLILWSLLAIKRVFFGVKRLV